LSLFLTHKKTYRKSLLGFLLIFSFAIQGFDINSFDSKNAFKLGAELMALPYGMHRIEPIEQSIETVVIGVHGSNSEGYEWVYPLWRLNNQSKAIYFFRWDDQECPNQRSDTLLKAIEKIVNLNKEVQSIQIMAHSYGGLYLLHALDLIEKFLNKNNLKLKVEIHFIASLLSPPKMLQVRCSLNKPSKKYKDLKIFNWKTIQALDGAFRTYKEDPQELSIIDSRQTRLPETYNGKKLGHNWSISWVADQLANK